MRASARQPERPGSFDSERSHASQPAWNRALRASRASREKRRRCGFTLIEIIAVVAIIAMIFGIGIPMLGGSRFDPLRNEADEIAERLDRKSVV